jgi:tripartite-type tricarboxylate transporter receptor subunit TctC
MKTIIRIFAAIAAAAAAQAFAQGYPNKPVHVMITFPPGSGTDIVGRIVTQKLSEFWGQPVVVENRGGAGGSIGAAVVAKAPPDGYMLMINSNAHAVNPAIYAKLPYDTLKDFVEIAPLAGAPNVLIVSSTSKLKSLADLLAEARSAPGKMNFASAGVGSGTHLNLESFKIATHVDVTHIPYKGTQEVMSDLLGERVPTCRPSLRAAFRGTNSLSGSGCGRRPGCRRSSSTRSTRT